MKKFVHIGLILPCFILVSVVLVVPILMVLAPSFFDGGFTLAHYMDFFKDPFYLTILWRTIWLSLITTLICGVLGLPVAFYISRQPRGRKNLLQSIVLFPLMTNAIIRAFAWMNILGTKGLINRMLLALHLVEKPIPMLYSEFAIVVGSVYLFLPVMITSLTAVMERIDDDVLMAAQSLGYRPLSVFGKVILPMSFSGLLVGSVLVFSGSISAYTTPTLLGGNKNMMLSTLLYQQVNSLNDWTTAGMIAFVMIVISLVVMKGLNHISRKLDRRAEIHA